MVAREGSTWPLKHPGGDDSRTPWLLASWSRCEDHHRTHPCPRAAVGVGGCGCVGGLGASAIASTSAKPTPTRTACGTVAPPTRNHSVGPVVVALVVKIAVAAVRDAPTTSTRTTWWSSLEPNHPMARGPWKEEHDSGNSHHSWESHRTHACGCCCYCCYYCYYYRCCCCLGHSQTEQELVVG